jgi:hypothetical protein
MNEPHHRPTIGAKQIQWRVSLHVSFAILLAVAVNLIIFAAGRRSSIADPRSAALYTDSDWPNTVLPATTMNRTPPPNRWPSPIPAIDEAKPALLAMLARRPSLRILVDAKSWESIIPVRDISRIENLMSSTDYCSEKLPVVPTSRRTQCYVGPWRVDLVLCVFYADFTVGRSRTYRVAGRLTRDGAGKWVAAMDRIARVMTWSLLRSADQRYRQTREAVELIPTLEEARRALAHLSRRGLDVGSMWARDRAVEKMQRHLRSVGNLESLSDGPATERDGYQEINGWQFSLVDRGFQKTIPFDSSGAGPEFFGYLECTPMGEWRAVPTELHVYDIVWHERDLGNTPAAAPRTPAFLPPVRPRSTRR